MKIIANLALGVAVLLLIYPMIPNLPAVRAAIMRTNHGPIGPAYALIFVLLPHWVRLTLASVSLWILLTLATQLTVRGGGLDWIGIGRVPQYLLVGAGCFAMAQIAVLVGLSRNGEADHVSDVLRAFSPWSVTVLPLVVMIFTFTTLNPSAGAFLSPWFYRAPLLAGFALALPVTGVLFVRWITPEPTSPVTISSSRSTTSP